MNAFFKLADLVVAATFQYEYLLKQCKDYVVRRPLSVDMEISVSSEDIAKERAKDNNGGFSNGYIESLAFYRKFAEQAAAFDCILFHGSALSVDGEGYLFGAPSGTGKSTHSALYRRQFGDRVEMVNDDKPLLRRMNGGFYVYGTPWDGKHHLSQNISVPLRGICFLQQGPINEIRKLTFFEAIGASLGQIYRPEDKEALSKVLHFTQGMLQSVPVFELKCTISNEAAELSYRTMKGAYNV
ncbi:MAG: hypothetical protein J6L76_01125 [Clostridia bacterium]|nr:hypothetical protein [Clostridia bacterium]